MMITFVKLLYFLLLLKQITAQTASPTATPSTFPPTASPSTAPTVSPTPSPTTLIDTKIWKPDVINYHSELLRFEGTNTWRYTLSINATGPIFEQNHGHFRLKFQIKYNNFTALKIFQPSSCLKIEENHIDIVKQLKTIPLLGFNQPEELKNIHSPILAEPYEEFYENFLIHMKRFYNDYNSTNYSETVFQLTLKSKELKRNITSIDVMLLTDEVDCSTPHTIGRWDDPSRWEYGIVPNITDDVIIPSQAGAIIIDEDVTIQSLNMSGGLIINYKTYCPDGWSIDPRGMEGSKCYRTFSEPLSFSAAERVCNAETGRGTRGRHLVHIRDAEEMTIALRMCRGMKGSAPFNEGCWIGLHDPLSTGDFQWISPDALELPSTATTLGAQATSWYLDWRRLEPNNQSVSEGIPSPALRGGERCAHIVPWQEDPLILEQGSWNDMGCELLKPFVCQMFGDTIRYTLHANKTMIINRGALEGGHLFTGVGASQILHLSIARSGSLLIGEHSTDSKIGTIFLQEGSSIVIDAPSIHVMSGAYVGELDSIFQRNTPSSMELISSTYSDTMTATSEVITDEIDAIAFTYDTSSATTRQVPITSAAALISTLLPLQPLIQINSNAKLFFSPLCGDDVDEVWPIQSLDDQYSRPPYPMRMSYAGIFQNQSCDPSASEVVLNGRIEAAGEFIVANATKILIPQTTDLSGAGSLFAGESAEIKIMGYSSRLSAYDAFNLNVSHRGPVIGEYSANITEEQMNQHLQSYRGVYRLRVFYSNNDTGIDSIYNVSTCIPYNATADQLKTILDQIPLIEERGFVTVRRYGNGENSNYRFGYTYRIEMDAPPTSSYDAGPLQIDVDCYGLDPSCQCAETIVPLVDFRGVPQCPTDSNYSQVFPNSCVIPPVLKVSRVTTLSHANITGPGKLSIEDGVHRLPPRSGTTISISRGTGVVAADFIDWLALSVSGTGRLVSAGTGWTAWDSSYLLYAPEWTYARGLTSVLGRAAPCNMFVDQFYLDAFGSVLSSSPQSNITWNNGIWGGGLIGGRSTLYLRGTMQVVEDNKSLRYGMTLWILSGAMMEWTSGNISLTDGADIIMEGNFTINSAKEGKEVFVGMSQLLDVESTDVIGRLLLEQSPGRNFHSYYGDELPNELRGGWYQNPLCGDQCLYTNHLIVRGFGVVEITTNSSVTFQLPLDLVGQSRVNIGNSVTQTLASGGICGNDVIIDVSSGTIMELSGGQMSMRATCTIQGEGELLVTAGLHNLAFSIDAHITIDGGTLLWPESNGPNQVITFNGGLLIRNTGELQVQPFSTTVLINKEVIMQDNALIQFPLLGIAAQASPFDEPDAPDPSPRGNLTVTGIMRLSGGTLRGKADFNALDALFLDNDAKYIQSLAKLVNKGHCEWANGDLITSDNGEFLNLGTVQMARGNSNFFSNALYKGTELPIDNGGDVFALEYHSWDTDNGGLDYTEYVRQRTLFVSRAPDGWTVEQQLSGAPQPSGYRR